MLIELRLATVRSRAAYFELRETQERSEDADLIVVLFEESAGALVERSRTSKIPLPTCELCEPEVRSRSLERLQMLGLVQNAGHPGLPLRVGRAQSPAPARCDSQAKGKLELALLERPPQRRSQIRKLALRSLLRRARERDFRQGHR